MFGVVVATHGKLGEELLHTAEGVVGPLAQACAIAVGSGGASMEDQRAALGKAIHSVDEGDGVLVLTDMFGGTPANLALTFLEESKIEVLTGVNLPMLLKVSTCRLEGMPLAPAAQMLAGYGQKNITLASELLRARTAKPKN